MEPQASAAPQETLAPKVLRAMMEDKEIPAPMAQKEPAAPLAPLAIPAMMEPAAPKETKVTADQQEMLAMQGALVMPEVTETQELKAMAEVVVAEEMEVGNFITK